MSFSLLLWRVKALYPCRGKGSPSCPQKEKTVSFVLVLSRREKKSPLPSCVERILRGISRWQIEKGLKKKTVEKNKNIFEKPLDKSAIIVYNTICSRESGGTGRRARLRGVWFIRTGSSPVSRTTKKGKSQDLPFLVSRDGTAFRHSRNASR